jgi:virulence factor
MISGLLSKFNTLRKEKLFNAPLYRSQQEYAFIGVGMHSLSNLYPLLQHFGVKLKYICTKNSTPPLQMAAQFPGCRFIHDIDVILNDNNIAGVFLCTNAAAHFELLSQLLKAGKAIFVEKPPCDNLTQLHQLIQLSPQAICKVGLQRRYWPANKYVARKGKGVRSYLYTFHLGPLVQGDPFTELFIHPLDYCNFLFGPYTLKSFSSNKDNKGISIQLHVTHELNVSGLIELSTHFSWNMPEDILQINGANEALTVQYPILVEGIQKPGRILNIPTERVLQQPVVRKTYFSAGNLLIPAIDMNTLQLQGFYHELEAFIQLVEGMPGAGKLVRNDLPGLVSVYKVIEEIRRG